MERSWHVSVAAASGYGEGRMVREQHLKEVAEANGGEIECLGSIRMMTADKKVLTGWLASQSDVLAEDWELIH